MTPEQREALITAIAFIEAVKADADALERALDVIDLSDEAFAEVVPVLQGMYDRSEPKEGDWFLT